jgi:hypothetical protein
MQEVERITREGYRPADYVERDEELKRCWHSSPRADSPAVIAKCCVHWWSR